MTGSALSLLDWLGEVTRSPQAQAQMTADPAAFLRDNGFDGLSAAEIHQALPLVADSIAASGGGWFDGLDARPDPVPMPGESELQATVRQIHYFSDHARFDEPADEDPVSHDPFDLDAHPGAAATVHLGPFDPFPDEPPLTDGDHRLDDLDARDGSHPAADEHGVSDQPTTVDAGFGRGAAPGAGDGAQDDGPDGNGHRPIAGSEHAGTAHTGSGHAGPVPHDPTDVDPDDLDAAASDGGHHTHLAAHEHVDTAPAGAGRDDIGHDTDHGTDPHDPI